VPYRLPAEKRATMGLYDRNYYGGGGYQPPGLKLGWPRSVVGWLILINVAIYLVDYSFAPNYYEVSYYDKQGNHVCGSGFVANKVLRSDPKYIAATEECNQELQRLIDEKKVSVNNLKSGPILVNHLSALNYFMAAKYDTLAKPYNIFQTLTYAFAHSMSEFTHILFNMLVLFFFGRDVERVLGRGEFLRFYLLAAIFGGLVWCTIALLSGNTGGQVVGASGAIAAVVILFCFKFPHRQVLLFFVIPMPAWVLGVLFIGLDLAGTFGHDVSGMKNVAYSVHLAGAAFGIIYVQAGWRLSNWLRMPGFLQSRGPRVRLHDPDRERRGGGTYQDESSYGSDNYGSDDPQPTRQERREAKRQEREAEKIRQREEEVDRILDKIQQHGQGSLTKKEQAILEERSRELREMRKNDDE